MRSVRYAVIDAFTDIPYRGNPAAVLLLEETKDTEWMQRVATEFNLSQTAFLRKRPPAPSRENGSALENCEEFDLRWFTPIIEVDLCGHATVAAAHFLFSSGFVKCNYVFFHTRSGILTAVKVEGFQQKRNAKSFARRVTEEFAVELNFPQTAVLDCDSLEIPSLSSTLDGLAVNGVKKTASGDILHMPHGRSGSKPLRIRASGVNFGTGNGRLVFAYTRGRFWTVQEVGFGQIGRLSLLQENLLKIYNLNSMKSRNALAEGSLSQGLLLSSLALILSPGSSVQNLASMRILCVGVLIVL